MPLFSRFKNKGSQPASKAKQAPEIPNGKPPTPQKPKWVTTWTSETLVPEEVQGLVHACTVEMKSRGMPVDMTNDCAHETRDTDGYPLTS